MEKTKPQFLIWRAKNKSPRKCQGNHRVGGVQGIDPPVLFMSSWAAPLSCSCIHPPLSSTPLIMDPTDRSMSRAHTHTLGRARLGLTQQHCFINGTDIVTTTHRKLVATCSKTILTRICTALNVYIRKRKISNY